MGSDICVLIEHVLKGPSRFLEYLGETKIRSVMAWVCFTNLPILGVLVLCQADIVGLRRFSLIRASSVVNLQSALALAALRRASG
ncbi:MAG: hypothetical protein BMS9Abin05_1220 [Rhodothermia bacterium]|nr:MAG: hypothetical protein BMS9Abin05_1220 [Rhodothermia bacterium]